MRAHLDILVRHDELADQGVKSEAIHSIASGDHKDGGATVQAVPSCQQSRPCKQTQPLKP